MPNIATLNVKLAATTGSFWKSMQKATKPVSALGNSVMSAGTKMAAFATPLAGLVAGGSMAYLISQSMEAIDSTGKLSDRLGIATESLIGLQHAANLSGVSGDELTGALEKMMKGLGGAADDGELASNAFTKLGLNAAELANLPTDDAFKQVAQRVSEIENPIERAAAAVGVFGKSGAALLPLLQTGAEGIAAAQAEAEKLGLTFSRVDAAKVEQAMDAMTRARGVVTGLAQTAAIELSPYIQAAAEAFTEWATAGGGFGDKVVAGVQAVATGVAYAADTLSLFKAGWYAVKSSVLLITYDLLKGIDLLGAGIVKVMNLLPGVNLEWTDTFSAMADSVWQDAGEAAAKAVAAWGDFASGKNSSAVTAFFDDVKARSQSTAEATAAAGAKMKGAFEDMGEGVSKAADAIAKLQTEIDQFGMTDAQKKMAGLTSLGAGPEQLKQADGMLAKLEKLNEAKQEQEDMQQKAQGIFDETRTPLEKYESKIGDLSGMLGAGKLTWDTYGRAVRAARDELEKASETSAPEAPDAIFAGSAQAIRMAYDMTTGNRTLRDNTPKQQLAVQRDSRDYLEEVARNTRNAAPASPTYPVVNI